MGRMAYGNGLPVETVGSNESELVQRDEAARWLPSKRSAHAMKETAPLLTDVFEKL